MDRQVRLFEEERETSVVYTEAWIIDGLGVSKGQLLNRDIILLPSGCEGNVFTSLLRYDFVLLGGVMLRKHCLSEERFDQKFFIGEDWDLLVRLARRYPFRYVADPLYGYRIYQGNAWKTRSFGRARAQPSIFEKWVTSFRELGNADRIYLLRCVFKECFERCDYRRLLVFASTERSVGLLIQETLANPKLLIRSLGTLIVGLSKC